jgi:FKBP-type peptidyl-prolyl cis-trans isomerase
MMRRLAHLAVVPFVLIGSAVAVSSTATAQKGPDAICADAQRLIGSDHSMAASNLKALFLRFTDPAAGVAQGRFIDQTCQDTGTGIGRRNTFPLASVQITGAIANQNGECRLTGVILGGCPPVAAGASPKPVESVQQVKPVESVQPAKPVETVQPAKPVETVQPVRPVESAPPAKSVASTQPGQTIELANGLKYTDTQPGNGAVAEKGYLVTVQYTGWVYRNGAKGAKFDSSVDRGKPLTFKLGAEQVIKGWDEGIAGMKTGGKRTLIIPPELAYGARGANGVVPPNATLIFDVELVSAR